jgi:hypothetical protein
MLERVAVVRGVDVNRESHDGLLCALRADAAAFSRSQNAR